MKPLYQRTLDALHQAGHEAYLVGGFVRDRLLGRPAKDIDITTSAFPDELVALFPGAKRVGAHFTITRLQEDQEAVEISTFRSDGDYAGETAPNDTSYTTDIVRDLERRDFTINALLMNAMGDTLDHVGGRDDLAGGMIRAVGDPALRFAEDPLRLLRAVRFKSELGFDIEPRTFQAMVSLAHLIKRVSVERVQQELNRILVSGRAREGLMQLEYAFLLHSILPDVAAMWDVPQNPRHHPEGDVFTHTGLLLSKLPAGCSLTLALAALLHDVGKPPSFALDKGQPTFHGHEEVGAVMTRRILTALRYGHDVIETVTSHVAQHMKFRYADQMRRAKLYRFIRQPNFGELLELHRIDSLSGSGNLTHYEFLLNVMKEVPEEVMRPEKLVTGRDLIGMGLGPGPVFRTILDTIEEAQLEGEITTRDQALTMAQAQVELFEMGAR